MILDVKELSVETIPPLVNYWMEASAEYLAGMGADINKVPSRSEMERMLNEQVGLAYKNKSSYALVWFADGMAIGHTNVNNLTYGEWGTMHLHLWNTRHRQKGMGQELVKQSLPYFFDNLRLKTIICEPYAHNPAPNKTLKRVGFRFVKTHRTVPGYLNFEQDVHRWELNYETFKFLKSL